MTHNLQIPSFSVANSPIGQSGKPSLFGGYFVMKNCIRCLTDQPIENFNKSKSTIGGYRNTCKSCTREQAKKSSKNLVPTILRTYHKQKARTRVKKLPEIGYNKKQLYDYLICNDEFILLHKEWAESGFKKELSPTIDRINPMLGYSFDNIQIMSWGENNRKGRHSIKTGLNTKTLVPVIQFDKNKNKIREYFSIAEASRITGINKSSISGCVNGRTKTCGGFIWKKK